MNDQHPPPQRPPPPLPIDHRTTTQILKQTTTIFTTHLLTFIFISFILLTFRSNVENGTHYLTSFIDRNPSLKSLLSRLAVAPTDNFPNHHHHHHYHHRRRRPFLQLTRVGTLEDDFFSGDEDVDRYFGSVPRTKPNGSYLILNKFDPRFGFSDFVSDNGIRVHEIVRSGGVSFKAPEQFLVSNVKEENENETVAAESEESSSKSEKMSDGFLDLQFILKGFELGHRDATALLFLIGILSASYGYVILGFVVTYAWVLGIVFVIGVNNLLNRYRSFFRTIWDGSNMGLKRLSGFILMRWAVRDALTQLLGIWFFGEIEDQYSFFKIFVRLKLMPFSVMSPWVKGFERESAGFLLCWFLLDTLVSFIFAVDAWVAMVDTRKSGREVVKEGCHLLSLMLNPAIHIKCLEGICCGSFARWVLSRVFGRFVAPAFQSVMEVYFMVAWLVYYFSVKFKDANSSGMPFGHRELEGFLEGVR